MRGTFITIEGIDGSGTTTQANALAMNLAQDDGKRVTLTAEPTDSLIGQAIRRLLQNTAVPVDPRTMALLFAADRLHHIQTLVEPALASGRHVVCCRYTLSSLAYQGTLARTGLERNWIEEANRFAMQPNLTILLDIPVQEARARRQRRGAPDERYNSDHELEQVRQAYLRLLPHAGRQTVVLDGRRDKRSLCTEILELALTACAMQGQPSC